MYYSYRSTTLVPVLNLSGVEVEIRLFLMILSPANIKTYTAVHTQLLIPDMHVLSYCICFQVNIWIFGSSRFVNSSDTQRASININY